MCREVGVGRKIESLLKIAVAEMSRLVHLAAVTLEKGRPQQEEAPS